MNKCALCNRYDEELKPLPYDDTPSLNRKYCSKCFPDVYRDHINSPWFETIKQRILKEQGKHKR